MWYRAVSDSITINENLSCGKGEGVSGGAAPAGIAQKAEKWVEKYRL